MKRNSMRTSRSLTEGPIAGALFRLSLPIIVANILQSAYQITDTFWVGRLSAEAVAAVSLAFPISFLMIAIGGGLPMAGSVLIAQYKGRGDTETMNHVATQTFLMVLAVSLVLTVIGFSCAEPILRLMGADTTVLPDATRYLQITFLGYAFVFGYFVFESLMRGTGEVRFPMMIVLVTVLMNIILDPLFIFGYGPIPAMGVAGAAMATLCTQATAALIGFTVLVSGRFGMRVHLKDLRPDFAFIKKAFFIGMPSSIEQSTRALGMTVMTMIASSFGTTIVAAYGIGIRMIMLVVIPALGFSMATSTLVGQNIGAGKIHRAEMTTYIGSLISFTVLSLVGVLLFVFAGQLTAFFVPGEPEVVMISKGFLRTIALSFGFIGIQMVMNGTFRGAGQTGVAMMIAIVSQWVLQFPAAYVLSQHTSLSYRGIWWSFVFSNVVSAIIAVSWFLRGDWKKKQLIEDSALIAKVRDETVTEEGITS